MARKFMLNQEGSVLILLKKFISLINPDEGDLRPLYYRQCKGELKLPVRGELSQSNKIVLKDLEWDKKAI